MTAIKTRPRCGYPAVDCGAPASAHNPDPAARYPWGYHTVQCQIPNPHVVIDPDPAGPVQCALPGYLNGYPVCAITDGHEGDHDYGRHAAQAEAG